MPPWHCLGHSWGLLDRSPARGPSDAGPQLAPPSQAQSRGKGGLEPGNTSSHRYTPGAGMREPPLNAPISQGASELRGPQVRHAAPSTLCQGPQAQVSKAFWIFCCSWRESLSRSPGPSHKNILGLWPPPPSFPDGGPLPHPSLLSTLMFLIHTGSQRDDVCLSVPLSLSHTLLHTHTTQST